MLEPVTFRCEACGAGWTQDIDCHREGLPRPLTANVELCEWCPESQAQQHPSADLSDPTVALDDEDQPHVFQPALSAAMAARARDTQTEGDSRSHWTIEENIVVLQLYEKYPNEGEGGKRADEFKKLFPYTHRTAHQLAAKRSYLRARKSTIEGFEKDIHGLIGFGTNWTYHEKFAILKICQDHPEYGFRDLWKQFKIRFSNVDQARSLNGVCSMWYWLWKNEARVEELQRIVEIEGRGGVVRSGGF